MYTIVKQVPLQQVQRKRESYRRKYPFDAMEVGDMFFVPGKNKNTMTTHVSNAGKDRSRKYATRLIYMVAVGEDEWLPATPTTTGAVKGVGVWRTL